MACATPQCDDDVAEPTALASFRSRQRMSIRFIAPYNGYTNAESSTATKAPRSDVVGDSAASPFNEFGTTTEAKIDCPSDCRLLVLSFEPDQIVDSSFGSWFHLPVEDTVHSLVRCHGTVEVQNSCRCESGWIQNSVLPGTKPAWSVDLPTPVAKDRKPDLRTRPTRLAYREYEKFFVAYMRIVKARGWSQIEIQFARTFGQPRGKVGLTSMYYRLRKEWALPEVHESQAEDKEAEFMAIRSHAANFSHDILAQFGYEDPRKASNPAPTHIKIVDTPPNLALP
ncbi:hypothetical protein D0864_04292 [Hortaea werneckii]|uniref:Uncharacterized protein n=1 Tax=Hortaea werneckii TaxID=91943 RepID=A0A3M7GC10_HORWE|nr:hypothetical protein D0864_04292 [Hortaea werneckii]